MDTPFYANAGNHTGHEIRPVPPVFNPASVAIAIVKAVERNRDYVFVPAVAAAMPVARAMWPGLTSRIARFIIDHLQIGSERAFHTSGNLYSPKSLIEKTEHKSKQGRRKRSWPVLTILAVSSAIALRELGNARKAA
jgi:hypothetical protein